MGRQSIWEWGIGLSQDATNQQAGAVPDGGADDSFHAFASGRVQGVGYRYFAVREAQRLGVAGSVRNLPDGRVEVWARGPRPVLEQLAAALRKGPFLGRVERLDLKWGVQPPVTGQFTVEF